MIDDINTYAELAEAVLKLEEVDFPKNVTIHIENKGLLLSIDKYMKTWSEHGVMTSVNFKMRQYTFVITK